MTGKPDLRETIEGYVRNCMDPNSMVIGSDDVRDAVDDIMSEIAALQSQLEAARRVKPYPLNTEFWAIVDVDNLIERLAELGAMTPDERARGKIANILAACDHAADALAAQRDRIAKLEAALGFYANNDNWRDGGFEYPEPNVMKLVYNSVNKDHGEKARAALDNTGGGNE